MNHSVRTAADTGRAAAQIEPATSRRAVLASLPAAALALGAMSLPDACNASQPAAAVATGAASITATGFASLAGKRVGLITNQTGRVGADHLADLMHRSPGLTLAAIFAPEHGFRGTAEAGAAVRDGRDPKTGVPVYSLYGAAKAPTAEMLRTVDVLVFDIQDVGVRFYTYISTMGLAMQAAAAHAKPFVVLDRPNPLGGETVSGFVLEPARKSFVGHYPIPIVHGLTVGELARMIKGERWLASLDSLELSVVAMRGWGRPMRWPATGLGWIATSPNIPTFACALAYPGIGIVGETLVNEGRGTPAPFTQFGAPWLDAADAVARLSGAGLPAVRFEATSYTPRPIPHVAADPRFAGQRINAVRLAITDVAAYRPLDVGIHALAHLQRAARARNAPLLDGRAMFHAIAGTTRLHQMVSRGAGAVDIIASWQDEVARFTRLRAKYLLY